MIIKLEKITPVESLQSPHRYLIKPYEAAKETKSGIVRENNSNTSSAKSIGTILKSSEGARFKIGQTVLFRRYSLDEVKYITPEGEQVADLVDDENILALVEQDI